MPPVLEKKKNLQGADFVSEMCFLISYKNPSTIEHIIPLIHTVSSLYTWNSRKLYNVRNIPKSLPMQSFPRFLSSVCFVWNWEPEWERKGRLSLRMGSAKQRLIRTGFLGIKAVTDFSPEERRVCFWRDRGLSVCNSVHPDSGLLRLFQKCYIPTIKVLIKHKFFLWFQWILLQELSPYSEQMWYCLASNHHKSKKLISILYRIIVS